jgi:hypothetical protein
MMPKTTKNCEEVLGRQQSAFDGLIHRRVPISQENDKNNGKKIFTPYIVNCSAFF